MKKKIVALSLLLVLLFSFASYAEVYDLADLLTEQEEQLLNAQLEQISQKHQLDLMLITTNDSLSMKPDLFAIEFYETKRSEPFPEEALIFAICMDIRSYGEAAYGERIEKKFTYSEDSVLPDVIAPHLTKGNYYQGFKSYLEYVDNRMTFHLPLIVIVPVAAFVALIIVFLMIQQMKHAKPKHAANYYTPNGINLTRKEDIYLYKTVTRTKIESNKSSGSSGGGRSVSSSSGRSYGGRSGKF